MRKVRSLVADGYDWGQTIAVIYYADQMPEDVEEQAVIIDPHLDEEWHPGLWDAASIAGQFTGDCTEAMIPEFKENIHIIDLRNN